MWQFSWQIVGVYSYVGIRCSLQLSPGRIDPQYDSIIYHTINIDLFTIHNCSFDPSSRVFVKSKEILLIRLSNFCY